MIYDDLLWLPQRNPRKMSIDGVHAEPLVRMMSLDEAPLARMMSVDETQATENGIDQF